MRRLAQNGGSDSPRKHRRGTFMLHFCLIALGLATALPAHGQTNNREAQLKAVFLYKFTGYVKWPDEAFASPQAPLVVGTVGNDPVVGVVKQIAGKRKANNRPIAHLAVSTGDQAKRCHILFVDDKVKPKLRDELVRATQGLPVLIVGETPGFLQAGGIINFVIINNNVRFKISVKNATDRGLKIGAQLAKLAVP